MTSSFTALEEALRSGISLQPILDSIGVAEMIRIMENAPPNLLAAYFQGKSAEFTARREIVTSFKLLQVAFTNKK